MRGAQAVVAASADRNLVTGRVLTYGNGTRGKSATPAGVATPFTYNGVLVTEVLPAIGTQTLVHAWVGAANTRGSNGDGGRSAGFLIGSSTNDVGLSAKGQWDGYSWSDQWGSLWDWNGQGDSGRVVPSGELLPLGRLCVLVTIRRGNRIEMWRDGVLIAAATKDVKSYAASAMILGGFIDNNYWWSNSHTVLAARLLADWSPQDVRAFSADPIGSMLETPQGFNPALLDPRMAQGSRAGYYAYGVWGDLLDANGGYFINGQGYAFGTVGAGYFDGQGGNQAG